MKRSLLYLFLIVLVACSTRVDVDFDLETFEREWRKWNEAQVAEYEYIYEVRGALNTYKVKVSGGECIVTEITDEGKDEKPDDNYRIENIYKKIKAAYDRSQGMEIKPCDNYYDYDSKIDVKYDIVNHIPISIHYIREVHEKIADVPETVTVTLDEYKAKAAVD